MALIRATCSDCGDVELRSRDLKIRRCRDTEAATYLFRCPTCAMIEVRSAEAHVVDVLLAAGVHSTDWSLPAELGERQRGAPITHDDVLDFHDMLTTTDWFSTLASMTDR
jgi:hypothetical protein